MTDEEIKEEPKQEESKQEEPVKEEEKEQPSLEKTINTLKEGYETKIAKLKADAERAISERDNVIKQLLNGDETANEPEPTIVDKINAKRQYKKW